MLRVEGPVEVLEWINNNAYQLNFSKDYSITFSMAYLSPYFACDMLQNLRANSSHQQEDDSD